MFECLVQHGCTDLSSLLSDDQYSELPIENGGFGDVWRVTLSDGMLIGSTVLAVKTLRLKPLLEGNNKAAKVGVWSLIEFHLPSTWNLLIYSVLRARCTTGPSYGTLMFKNYWALLSTKAD